MNYLSLCLEDFKELRLPEPDFRVQMCGRCKNTKCDFSRWSTDPMAVRAATQMDRFFNAEQADPRSSRYEGLIDFREQRTDWAPTELVSSSGSGITMVDKPKIILPAKRNTEVPQGGIILGGNSAKTAPKPLDPWAAPSSVPNKVEPGARIRMGLAPEKKE